MKVVNTKVWSGNYFRDFNGQSLNRQLFVEELARDAVGEDALTKNICPDASLAKNICARPLAALTTKPEDLQNRLRGTPTPGCEPSFKRYESEKTALDEGSVRHALSSSPSVTVNPEAEQGSSVVLLAALDATNIATMLWRVSTRMFGRQRSWQLHRRTSGT